MSACVACGKIFQCGMADAGAPDPCWCTQLPPLPPERLAAANASGQAACFCPACLGALATAGGTGGTGGSGTIAQRDAGKT